MPPATEPTSNKRLKEKFSAPFFTNIYRQKIKEGLLPPEKIIIGQCLRKDGLTLDIGCGPGRTLIPLQQEGYQIIGVDFSPDLLKLAQHHLTTNGLVPRLILGDWREIPVKQGAFHAVTAFESTISYFKKSQRILMFKEAARVLESGGIFLLCVDNNGKPLRFPYSLKLPDFFEPILKMLGEKKRAFWLLCLDIASVSIPSFFIDPSRALRSRIFKGGYAGPKPKERFGAASKLPREIYRPDDVKEETASCGLQIIDYQADWELVFHDALPPFIKNRAPITYYFIQKKESPRHPDVKFSEAVPLLDIAFAKQGTMDFQIIHNSMAPFLLPGDIVCGRQTAAEDLKTGDILILKSPSALIAHRLVSVRDASFIMKGDHLEDFDNPIPADSIVAKITAIKTNSRSFNLETGYWKWINRCLALISREEAKCKRSLLYAACIKLLKKLFYMSNPPLIFLYRRKNNGSLEKELIIRLCESSICAEKKDILEDLALKVQNWNRFLSLILYNNVGPLVYKNLSRVADLHIPFWVSRRLKEIYTESFLQTEPFYRDLKILLNEFNQRNISVIVLKGAAIAQELYDDIALRPLKDIDILAKKEDWPSIREILRGIGYKNKEGLDLLELDRLSPVDMDRHVAYENDRMTKIEFKFNLFSLDFPEFENTKQYWETAQQKNLSGTGMLTLNAEDQFLYLCSRMINVGFRYLLWFIDLKEFLHFHQNIDWGCVIDKARAKKITPVLFYTLTILKEDFSVVSIPDQIMDALKPGALKQEIFRIFFGSGHKGFRPFGKNASFPDPMITNYLLLNKWRTGPRPSLAALRMAFRTLFPPAGYIAYRYHIPLWQAYTGRDYLRRFLRLFKRIFLP